MIRSIIDNIVLRVALFILGILIAILGLLFPHRSLYALEVMSKDMMKSKALDALTKCKDC